MAGSKDKYKYWGLWNTHKLVTEKWLSGFNSLCLKWQVFFWCAIAIIKGISHTYQGIPTICKLDILQRVEISWFTNKNPRIPRSSFCYKKLKVLVDYKVAKLRLISLPSQLNLAFSWFWVSAIFGILYVKMK